MKDNWQATIVSENNYSRIHKGVLAGLEGGEQATLSFEQFPHVALSKTYCVDRYCNVHFISICRTYLVTALWLTVLAVPPPTWVE